MRIISVKTLKLFWKRHGDAQQSLQAWYYEVKQEQWRNPHDIKQKYRTASILKNNRIVFNVAGNKYRLVTSVNYNLQIVFIRFIGTHKQYDKINAETI